MSQLYTQLLISNNELIRKKYDDKNLMIHIVQIEIR